MVGSLDRSSGTASGRRQVRTAAAAQQTAVSVPRREPPRAPGPSAPRTVVPHPVALSPPGRPANPTPVPITPRAVPAPPPSQPKLLDRLRKPLRPRRHSDLSAVAQAGLSAVWAQAGRAEEVRRHRTKRFFLNSANLTPVSPVWVGLEENGDSGNLPHHGDGGCRRLRAGPGVGGAVRR